MSQASRTYVSRNVIMPDIPELAEADSNIISVLACLSLTYNQRELLEFFPVTTRARAAKARGEYVDEKGKYLRMEMVLPPRPKRKANVPTTNTRIRQRQQRQESSVMQEDEKKRREEEMQEAEIERKLVTVPTFMQRAFDFMQSPMKWHDLTNPATVQRDQEQDEYIIEVKKELQRIVEEEKADEETDTKVPVFVKANIDSLTDRDNILFYNDRIVAPAHLVAQIIRYYHTHTVAHHMSAKNTYDAASKEWWWPEMSSQINEFVSTCITCQRHQVGHHPYIGEPRYFPAKFVNEVLHMDLVGPLEPDIVGMIYILSMLDRFSCYIETVCLVDATATSVAIALCNNWISRWGMPKHVITDRGSQFIGNLSARILKTFKIKPKFTTSWHPETNGKVERWHRDLKKRLAKAFTDRDVEELYDLPWSFLVPSIAAIHNNTKSAATKLAPNQIMKGSVNVFKITNIPTKTELQRIVPESKEHHVTVLNDIMKNFRHAARTNKQKYIKNRKKRERRQYRP